MSEQPKASREITPTTGRKDRALEANGVAWNIMSEHQRETAFLRQRILYDDTGERHKLEESITQLQRNDLCVRRAVWLMALLVALAMAGLCYAAVFVAEERGQSRRTLYFESGQRNGNAGEIPTKRGNEKNIWFSGTDPFLTPLQLKDGALSFNLAGES